MMSAGRNAAAALTLGGRICAAASEERYNRIKASEAFPVRSISSCLQTEGISLSEVSRIAHAFDFEPYSELFRRMDIGKRRFETVLSRDAFLAEATKHFPQFDWENKFLSVPHHLAHAASAFCPSPFSEAIILVADGMGELHSLSIYEVRAGELRQLRQISAGHSLGILFGVLTHFLGFTMDRDEYKVMGLAAYGDPSRYLPEFQDLIVLCEDGRVTVPLFRENASEEEHENHTGSLRELSRLFGPARLPGGELTRREADIAAALQESLRTALFHLLSWARSQSPVEHLALAGGVALNSKVNGELLRSGMFRSLFVQPAAGDEGAALGASLVANDPERWFASNVPMDMPYFGPVESEDATERVLRDEHICFERVSDTELSRRVAQLLEQGAIVAWHQGRMEFGPRALGNRSILADPRSRAMRERINLLIKSRESFRPLAPLVSLQQARQIFAINPGEEKMFRYMTVNAEVRPEWRERLQAVTHEDGSARLQVLFPQDNPRLSRLLECFSEATEVPVLLNTSLNIRGEPISCDTADSIRIFRESAIDVLCIGNFVVRR